MKIRNLFALLVALMLFATAFPQSKTSPKRDPKTGRFVKSEGTKKKSGPARDPKTGRFIKTTDTTSKKKGGPARDPKTGKFIKKSGG